MLNDNLFGAVLRLQQIIAACLAQSKKSFSSKLSIVIEEADESEFWLQFIIDEKIKIKNVIEPLRKEANKLASIFIVSRKTVKKICDC